MSSSSSTVEALRSAPSPRPARVASSTGLGGAGDGHVGHVGGPDGARAVGDGAGLATGVAGHRDVVGVTGGQQGGGGKVAGGREGEVVTGIVLEDDLPLRPATLPPTEYVPATLPPDQSPALAVPLAMMPGAPRSSWCRWR